MGDANLTANSITMGPLAVISGNLSYQSKSPITFPPVVKGKTSFHQINYDLPTVNNISRNRFHEAALVLGTLFRIFLFVTTFIVGTIFVLIFPAFFNKSSQFLQASLISSFKWGITLSLLFFLVFFVLIASIIGIPLAVTFIPLWILLIFISNLSSAVYVGRLLFKDTGVYVAFVLGLIILTLLRQVPVAGWILSLVISFLGLGSVYLAWRPNKQ